MSGRNLVFVGVGRVGTALAVALEQRGYRVLAVEDLDPRALERARRRLRGAEVGITPETARLADAVFITTRDDAIGAVAANLASRFSWSEKRVFVHTSGSLTSSVLGDGARLSFHPLQSFAQVEDAVERISKSVVTLEGDGRGLEFGRELALALGVRCVEIAPHQKPLYHLAACVACNYAVTLVHEAKMVLLELGFSQELAEEGLLSLLSGTLGNMERLGVEKAITGPIARGDVETIRSHLGALRGRDALKRLYSLLGVHTARMALGTGTPAEGRDTRLREIEELLSGSET